MLKKVLAKIKTNYSLHRIEQLSEVARKLHYKRDNKRYLTQKEIRLYNKIVYCILLQEIKPPITEPIKIDFIENQNLRVFIY